jgi:hypothetical protein
MSIFSSIWDRIRGRRNEAKPTSAPAPQVTPGAAAPAAAAPVDVEAVLVSMAEMKGDGAGNWRTSIVDLLKLLGLDSSLEARKELAQELGVNAGPHGSAEQNIALSKAVWRKMAENGGLVPDSLRN